MPRVAGGVDGDDPAPILHSFSDTTHVYAGRFVFELPNTIIYYYITKYYSYNNTMTLKVPSFLRGANGWWGGN